MDRLYRCHTCNEDFKKPEPTLTTGRNWRGKKKCVDFHDYCGHANYSRKGGCSDHRKGLEGYDYRKIGVASNDGIGSYDTIRIEHYGR